MGIFQNLFSGLKGLVSKGAGLIGNLFSKGGSALKNIIGHAREGANIASNLYNKATTAFPALGQTLGEYKNAVADTWNKVKGGAHQISNAMSNFGNTAVDYGKTLDLKGLNERGGNAVSNLIEGGGKIADGIKSGFNKARSFLSGR